MLIYILHKGVIAPGTRVVVMASVLKVCVSEESNYRHVCLRVDL